jgi:serine phosphatase RsbU (regulator of sigma subunit)
MPFRILPVTLDKSASPLRRALQYAFYDWTRDMPPPRRIVATVGLLVPAAVLSGLLIAIRHPAIAIPLAVLFLIGLILLNGALTSEFVRKMQLESDQIAAQQIQQTLQAQNPESLLGYDRQTFYRPFRDVGGDYFDIIALPHNRTLFAVADVSGKGVPAALLAANIQALVRSIASIDADPLTMARQINSHLSRYTPADRFATAVFMVLSRDSGELLYVNAGHNAPIVSCSGTTAFLEATGLPLGIFAEAKYESRTAVIQPDGALLLFTDGLTDSIAARNPEECLRDVLADGSSSRMDRIKSLVDPKLNDDDVTILLVRRAVGSNCGNSQREGHRVGPTAA